MSYVEAVRTFVRVHDLGSMSAAGRDLRISPAVASSRIAQLEDRLGVRLFQRTTRTLAPTEQGRVFYDGACRILDTIEEAEAMVQNITRNPRGSLHIAAPLGVGRRFVAPLVPAFKQEYPLVDIRLRLSDRRIDLAGEGLDVAFFLGVPEDSSATMRKIAECERILCASPDYLSRRGVPSGVQDLVDGTHDCLNLRYPGAPEFQWPLIVGGNVIRHAVTGPFESDDGDVLTNWALEGWGVALKPVFEVADHLDSGALVPVLTDTPPTPVQFVCLYTHRRRQDPKTRLFIDFAVSRITPLFRSASDKARHHSPYSQT